jgi:hypothetical protein
MAGMKKTTWMAAVLAGAAAAMTPVCVQAQDKHATSAKMASGPRSFATPDEGATALLDAVRAGKAQGILAIIGPASKSWLLSGDPVADRADWQHFLEAYDKKHAITMESDAKALIAAGDGDWTFPAPLVKKGDRWVFDEAAGREEALNRRVGRNELNTIQTLLAVVDAQREYAETEGGAKGLVHYASKFRSSPGQRDGLYWPTKAGEPPSPLGPLVAQATREGYGGANAKADGQGTYHGYRYHLLTGQGKDATGGAFNYVVNGKLFGGFGVIAWPASYGNSGVKSFIVNHEGVVYAKDLGPQSAAEAEKMKLFNPDASWAKVP